MSTQEQREQWAGMFGFVQEAEDVGSSRGWLDRSDEAGFPKGRWVKQLPDFAALDGPYVGPAMKELIDAGYDIDRTAASTPPYEYGYLQPSLGAGYFVWFDDLGVCVMEALYDLRRSDKARQP